MSAFSYYEFNIYVIRLKIPCLKWHFKWHFACVEELVDETVSQVMWLAYVSAGAFQMNRILAAPHTSTVILVRVPPYLLSVMCMCTNTPTCVR